MIDSFAPNHDLLVLSAVLGDPVAVEDSIVRAVRRLRPSLWEEQIGIISLSDCYISCPPAGSAHPHKVVIFRLKNGNGVLFTANLEDGWSSLAYVVSAELEVPAFVFRFASEKVNYAPRSFTALSKGDSIRHVGVYFDRKWVFVEEGAALAMEDKSLYRRKVIKTRLTNEYLVALADRCGIVLPESEELNDSGRIVMEKRVKKKFIDTVTIKIGCRK